ncbi:hypothetical protein SS50377_28540 [Spironucleus salmonicida]|uniref:Uncharacterized protein n=1 Tax=Spironucleus salmonicida TaxID=348837 RepID=V6LBK1_9EUKA|nr:hypothetical protein SS50377_28540 [Spironucleus salmonicida]|eukprot:EST41628.1 Hypothetical protein SS50377_18983 [Spironucleus salmonicida]
MGDDKRKDADTLEEMSAAIIVLLVLLILIFIVFSVVFCLCFSKIKKQSKVILEVLNNNMIRQQQKDHQIDILLRNQAVSQPNVNQAGEQYLPPQLPQML